MGNARTHGPEVEYTPMRGIVYLRRYWCTGAKLVVGNSRTHGPEAEYIPMRGIVYLYGGIGVRVPS